MSIRDALIDAEQHRERTGLAICRRCGSAFVPDRRPAADAGRLCPACRDPEPIGPRACPICHRWLKSGRHRGPCPGRRRRRGTAIVKPRIPG